MDRRAMLHLGLLLLAVPVQYLVTKIVISTEAQRSYAIRNLLSSALGFKNNYLSWKSWKKWCINILQTFKYTDSPEDSFDDTEDENGESPAIEVMRYNAPKGYFGESTDPRTPRAPEVKYRVGQVIKHKMWGYKGVIIGWDKSAKVSLSIQTEVTSNA
ncbi:hypothetical protein ACJMK2_028711 [Sinanodonta woodiana]|uniref:Hemimethylated DNA-binding domain-containing protein n=1 Tax=Sinanodonta woodiana TaxID=1069815 RepID=A0ABD3XBV5_SINWO